MRLLLIDHGNCDHDRTRVHLIRGGLERQGIRAAVCGPSSVPQLEQVHAGMYGIHLHAIAAASHRFLAAVEAGTAEALLETVPHLPPRLFGLVRETARQLVVEAVDATDPEAIFVMHAGVLTDLAVETGAPVVVHVSGADLDAAATKPQMRTLVRRAIGSCDLVVAADGATAKGLEAGWIDDDALCAEAWPVDADAPRRILAACREAVRRRRG